MSNSLTSLLNISILRQVVDTTIEKGYTWSDAVNVVICGMAIVFIMLIFLVFIIWAFGTIMDKAIKKPKTNLEKQAEIKSQATTTKTTENTVDDDEIVAVISAAVDCMYSGTSKKPIIKFIKKSNSNNRRNAWGFAGVFKNTRAF